MTDTTFPIRVRMSAEALQELHSCEYGSYEDHIHGPGICPDCEAFHNVRLGEYHQRPDGTFKLHCVEIIERDGYKTVVILRTQEELDEFFGQSMTGTWGLYHKRTALRVYDELIDLVSEDVRKAISRYSIGY